MLLYNLLLEPIQLRMWITGDIFVLDQWTIVCLIWLTQTNFEFMESFMLLLFINLMVLSQAWYEISQLLRKLEYWF